jgi:hypothetical protein
MDIKRSDDRSTDLANKTPVEDDYLHVHIGVDLKLSPKQVGTKIWGTAMNVGKQLVIWFLSGSIVVNTPDPQYPQIPVLPNSIEQTQKP